MRSPAIMLIIKLVASSRPFHQISRAQVREPSTRERNAVCRAKSFPRCGGGGSSYRLQPLIISAVGTFPSTQIPATMAYPLIGSTVQPVTSEASSAGLACPSCTATFGRQEHLQRHITSSRMSTFCPRTRSWLTRGQQRHCRQAFSMHILRSGFRSTRRTRPAFEVLQG